MGAVARPGPAEEPERLDELRRRLYRAGATDEDVRRYTDERGVPAPAALDRPDVPGTERRSGRRRALLRGAMVAAGLAVVVAAGTALAARPPTEPAAQGSPAADSRVGSGSPAPEAVPSPRVRAAGGGGVQEFRGRGSGAAALDPSSLSFHGGRVAVVLTPELTSAIGWNAVRVEPRAGRAAAEHVLARQRAAEQRSTSETGGGAIPVDFTYTGAPPTRIDVRAAPGIAWTLIVVVDDRAGSSQP